MIRKGSATFKPAADTQDRYSEQTYEQLEAEFFEQCIIQLKSDKTFKAIYRDINKAERLNFPYSKDKAHIGHCAKIDAEMKSISWSRRILGALSCMGNARSVPYIKELLRTV